MSGGGTPAPPGGAAAAEATRRLEAYLRAVRAMADSETAGRPRAPACALVDAQRRGLFSPGQAADLLGPLLCGGPATTPAP